MNLETPTNCENFKLGIYEKALPTGLEWKERLDLAEELGFQFVEMSIDETDNRLERLKWNRTERRNFRTVLDQSDTGVPSLCLSGHRRFPLGSRDPAIRLRASEILRDAILLAVDTGIRTIQLAGYDVYYEESDEQTEQLFKEGLIKGLELATREQVMLAMEIMDTRYMSSIIRFLNLKRELNSPWLSLYPDIGNLSAWGCDVEQELEIGMEHIVSIHLKDTLAVTENFPGRFRDVPFGKGCVDFARIFKVLHNLKYCGPFLMEMWTENVLRPKEEIQKARDWILCRMREAKYL